MTAKATDFTLAAWVEVPTASEKGCVVHVGAADGSDGYSLGIGNTTFDNAGNKLIFEACPNQWTVFGNIGTGWHHIAAVVDPSGYVTGYVDGVRLVDPATTAWVAAVVTAGGTVSSPRQTIVDTLICQLKFYGIWAKLDRLWVLAAENSQSALCDLIANQSSSIGGSPTFTVDRGYYGVDQNSSTNYIYTGFQVWNYASGYKFKQASAHVSAWCLTNKQTVNADRCVAIGINYQSECWLDLWTRFTYGEIGWTLNVQSGTVQSRANTRLGHWIINRTPPNQIDLIYNGASQGLAGSWTPTPDGYGQPFTILCSNTPLYECSNQIAVISIGGGLTQTDVSNFYNCLNTYLTAIGAVGVSATVATWVAAVVAAGGSVSSGRQTLVSNLITGLIADGVWAKLDRLYLLAAENQASALIDIVALSQATAVNTPTFTTDRGITGGSGKYIQTSYKGDFAVGNKYKQDSSHLSAWVFNNDTTKASGSFAGENTSDVTLLGWNSGTPGQIVATSTSQSGAAPSPNVGNNAGLWTVTRPAPGANGCFLYWNGSQFNSGFGGNSTISSGDFYIGMENLAGPGNAYLDVISAVTIGGGLTATDAANLYSRLLTYFTAIFANKWSDAVVTNGGTVSAGRKTLVSNLIGGLISDGVWGKLDRLWLFAAENSQSALLDLVVDGQATAVNSPGFTIDRGYTGEDSNSPSKYIDSNFDPTAFAGNYKAANAHISGWVTTNLARSVATRSILFGYNSNNSTWLSLDDTTGHLRYILNNGSAETDGGTPATFVGHWLLNRPSSSEQDLYRNGTSYTTDTSNSNYSATAGYSVKVLCRVDGTNSPTYGTQNQCAAFSIGSSLTTTDITNLYTRLRTYMTAVGVP